MTGLKSIIDYLDITILNIELFTVRTEWNYDNVSNPYSRLYYITEGYGRIRHHDREYDLVPGHLYLIPCYTTVDMFCPESFTHYYVHFTSRLQTGLDIFSILECNYQASISGTLVNHSMFDRLLELNPHKKLIEYNANKPIYQQVLERTLGLDQDKSPANIFETNAIMRLLFSAFFSDDSHPKVFNTLHGLKRFEKVLTYVQDHIDHPMTIPQLAKIANLNPTYFSNLFSKLIGTPPLQYINKRRIEKAQELLLGTDETLYEIAHQIGLNDEYYFSRLFKKQVGISPDHYRKQEQVHHQR
ncbi:MAG: AraC family transcriptional regulator [Planctomycetota bacterium]|jgi:AraC-like DNA-binding protein